MSNPNSGRVFYGWWIVVAAFLNLFFSVGIIYYGFPVFYPSLVQSLGFTRAQLIQGFFIGFAVAAVLLGVLAGVVIDRWGARPVILAGIWLVGVPLILMGRMTRLWHYYVLCIAEVAGYVLTGPIPNQVLISNWFRARRGRAMGYSYLGLGVGGVAAPLLINGLIARYGWRRAFEVIGVLILVVLFPIAQWVTRSAPEEMGLSPDGAPASLDTEGGEGPATREAESADVRRAVHSLNFWLILAGCTLTIGAIGTVIQHFILFLKDVGYSTAAAAHISSGLLVASLAGRVIVGYIADRFRRKNVMALFYLVLGLAIPLLFVAGRPAAAWGFAAVFGFAMGADYMLIPLVTAECFGLEALGKLLALLIMGYSLGQWFGPWLAGRIFDSTHSYHSVWLIMAVAGIIGGITIYAVAPERQRPSLSSPKSERKK
ncbi:MAG TPA: MFS transporter [Terriglobia bacterium]|nr:MFS transporter [Terriglobia bacterium]